ncbi:MAG: hypothetical protein AVDCRST_MAG48-6, partial [uncultured Friedmanniella sp.]
VAAGGGAEPRRERPLLAGVSPEPPQPVPTPPEVSTADL